MSVHGLLTVLNKEGGVRECINCPSVMFCLKTREKGVKAESGEVT